MTAFNAVFYLTLYAPRSVDATEATVLTPIGGAAHSDNFKVASRSGLAGFQPYLDGESVAVQDSTFSPLTKRLTIGQWSLRVLDRRVTAGGSQATSWFTAFLGNSSGINRLIGLKALLEESTDGGSTKSTLATLRVTAVRVDEDKKFALLQLRNAGDGLRARVFSTTPHADVASYASRPSLLPVGLRVAYGPYAATARLGMYVKTGSRNANQRSFTLSISNGVPDIEVRKATDPAAFVPKALSDLLGKTQVALNGGDPTNYPDYLRVSIDGVGEYKVRSMRTTNGYCQEIVLDELPTTDPAYAAYNVVAEGAAANIFTIPGRATAISAAYPLFISDVALGTLFKALLDGKFGNLSAAGAALRTYAYDGTLTTLANNTAPFDRVPPGRFVITEAASLAEFVEQQLCQLGAFGYRFDASNNVTVFNLRLPSTAPAVATITEADLDAHAPQPWDLAMSEAVTQMNVTSYIDEYRTTEEWITLYGTAAAERIPPGGLRWTDNGLVDPTFGSVDLEEQPYTLDLLGLRTTVNASEVTNSRPRSEWVRGIIDGLLEELRPTYSRGTTVLPLVCRRTANTNIQVGDFALLTVNSFPNPATNQRSGTRLARCVGRQNRGGRRYLRFLDSGLSVVSSVPTIGTIALETGNPSGVKVPITLGGGDAEIWVAVTATSVGSAPAEGNAAWRFAVRATSTGDWFVRNLPRGTRAWIRARTVTVGTGQPAQLPSAFVAAAAPAYIDTTALTAPSALAEDDVTGTSFAVDFTLGETTFPTLVTVSPAILGVTEWTLPAGAARFAVVGAIPVTTYTVSMKHIDGLGGESASASEPGGVTTSAAPGPDAPVLHVVISETVPPVTIGGQTRDWHFWTQCYVQVPDYVAGSKVAIYVALETTPGAGTYGAYAFYSDVPSVDGAWTIWPAGGRGGYTIDNNWYPEAAPFVVGDFVGILNIGYDSLLKYKVKCRVEVGTLGTAGTGLSSYSNEVTVDPTTPATYDFPTLPGEYGGTSLNPGDLSVGSLITSTVTDWAAVAAVAAGNVLLAQGIGAAPAYGKITNAHVDAAAAIAWSKLDKAGSSLADLTTRSASDLSSGNLAYARLPTGGGTWANGGALSITGGVTTVAGLTSSALVTANAAISATASGQVAIYTAGDKSLVVGSATDRLSGVGSTENAIGIESGKPGLYFWEDDATVNNRMTLFYAQTEDFYLAFHTDDLSAGDTIFKVHRTGGTHDLFEFPTGKIGITATSGLYLGTSDPGGGKLLRVKGTNEGISFDGDTILRRTTGGGLSLYNAAETVLQPLVVGGITSTFVQSGAAADLLLKYNTTTKVTVGTGNVTFADGVILGAPARLKSYTVAGLPAGVQGDFALVTDALAPTYNATLVGGGAVVVRASHNGTTWVAA